MTYKAISTRDKPENTTSGNLGDISSDFPFSLGEQGEGDENVMVLTFRHSRRQSK